MGIVKVGLIVLVISSCVLAATIRVPQDQTTIQAGINAALDGDTVLVGPGVYIESISFIGKKIALKSVAGPDSTVITTASPANAVVSMSNAEPKGAILEGFTVRGGSAGGIRCSGSSPTILRNVIEFNTSDCENCGAGIEMENTSASLIKENVIRYNSANTYGAGIHIGDDNASSTNDTICYNVFYENSGYGEIRVLKLVTGLCIYNNTIAATTYNGLQIQINTPGVVEVRNNIIFNAPAWGVYSWSSNTVDVDYNCTYDNQADYSYPPGPHGVYLPAEFVNESGNDFRILPTSPCIDAGDPNPIYNDPDGSRNDIGALAYEPISGRIRYVPGEYVTIQSAIDAAADGDTVLVDDGHYFERISFLGKRIVVASHYLVDSDTLHVYETIIDGDTSVVQMDNDTGSVARFVNQEDSSSLLVGFTLQHGVGIGNMGGAIFCFLSGPTLRKLRVIDNGSLSAVMFKSYFDKGALVDSCFISDNFGSGIRCENEGLVSFRGCSITWNSGAGVQCENSAYIRASDCWIAHNLASGIDIMGGRYDVIRNCVIEYNGNGGIGWAGSALVREQGSYPAYSDSRVPSRLLTNCIIRQNTSGIYLYNDWEWTVDSCLFEDNTNFAIGVADDVRLIVRNTVFLRNGSMTDGAVGGVLRFIGSQFVGIEFYNSSFLRNKSDKGGVFGVRNNCPFIVSGCTFFGNTANEGSAIYQGRCISQKMLIERCVIAFSGGTSVIARQAPDPSYPNCSDSMQFVFSCTDIFGNGGGDWTGQLSAFVGSAGNFSVNPLFCDTANSIFTIRDSSPCAPENDSCGILIGAYGVGCENAPPVLTSESERTIIRRVPFTYIATSVDNDGPSASYSFLNLPSWLNSADDSCFGTPEVDDSDTSFTVVVSDGFLADTMIVTLHLLETPVVSGVTVDGSTEPHHVMTAAPLLGWDYSDTTGIYPQTAVEIGVGTDNNWQYAEMWNPAPFASEDTFVTYGGAPLIDGQTYWLRLRVSNSLGWSNWAELMFRMNSVPTTPELVAPAHNEIMSSQQPSLTIRRVSDAEGDSLLLTFEIANDSLFSFFVPFTAQPSSDSLTTVNVPFYLTEDQRYWWRVTASDYYEESNYSPIWSFWINSENSAPTHFDLIAPANSFEPALTTTTLLLEWTQSNDIDPFDQVSYALHLAIDSSFSFASITSGIDGTSWQPSEPLNWGTKYWWKVKATDLSTGVTWSNQVYRFRIMRPGDPDGNGQISISDAVFLINYIFAGGPAPVPLLSGDADCSGAISISDAVYLINYIFGGGPEPCEL